MKYKSAIAALFAFSLLAAACGDDDAGSGSGGLSPELQEYADAFADSLDATFNEDSQVMSEAETQCIAEETVQVFGLEKLQAAGTPEELATSTEDDFSDIEPTDDEIGKVVDAMFDCADIAKLAVDSIAEEIPGGATDEQRSCIADAFDEDTIREIFETTLADEGAEPDIDQSVFEDVLACIG